MVNTNVLVSCFGERLDGTTEHDEFLSWAWQILIFNLTLRFKTCWQVGIIKDREAIRRHLDNSRHRMGKGLRGLMR